ncbi:MAG: GNAT family N-acetyltransferase [Alphaproteobacteria bacterium]|nr:GNAT family N-acetyltransferase [Alphaproteobacteria bacterium SS10]
MAKDKKPDEIVGTSFPRPGISDGQSASLDYEASAVDVEVKTASEGVTFEKLEKSKHDRLNFSSGDPEIDNYLKKNARQSMARGDSLTMVAVAHDPNRMKAEILGYVTVLPVTYREGTGPAERLGVEGRDANALLIGKVGVDEKHQGKGLGTAMMASALSRAAAIQGLDGVSIDPKHNKDHLRSMYEHVGFESAADTGAEGGVTMTMKAEAIEPALDRIAAKSNVMNFEGWRERLAERKAAKDAGISGPSVAQGLAAEVVKPKM